MCACATFIDEACPSLLQLKGIQDSGLTFNGTSPPLV